MTRAIYVYMWDIKCCSLTHFDMIQQTQLLLLLLLYPFNGLFFQDNLGKPAPER